MLFRSLSLVPSEVGRGMSVVERSLKDLEQKLLKLAKERLSAYIIFSGLKHIGDDA